MQEQKLYTIEDYRALQDTPAEPFKADLRMMCRAAFGPDWTDQHPGQAAIDRLRGYGFLPEEFIGINSRESVSPTAVTRKTMWSTRSPL